MKKRRLVPLIFLLCHFSLSCQDVHLDPWGIWNKRVVTKEDNRRAINDEHFYEAGDDGLWILKDGKDRFSGKVNGPIFAVTGAFIRILNYENSGNEYLFTLQGEGFRHNPATGKPEWKDDLVFIIKMVMIDNEKCKFKYVSEFKDGDFKMSYLPLPGNIYYRMRD